MAFSARSGRSFAESRRHLTLAATSRPASPTHPTPPGANPTKQPLKSGTTSTDDTPTTSATPRRATGPHRLRHARAAVRKLVAAHGGSGVRRLVGSAGPRGRRPARGRAELGPARRRLLARLRAPGRQARAAKGHSSRRARCQRRRCESKPSDG